jgi:organic hydroperoxide reductase OsmC/OhrA
LKPRVTILSGSNRELAQQLHHDAHDFCFIANSVKFPVETEADIAIAQ